MRIYSLVVVAWGIAVAIVPWLIVEDGQSIAVIISFLGAMICMSGFRMWARS